MNVIQLVGLLFIIYVSTLILHCFVEYFIATQKPNYDGAIGGENIHRDLYEAVIGADIQEDDLSK